jgi:hypothetical protein
MYKQKPTAKAMERKARGNKKGKKLGYSLVTSF